MVIEYDIKIYILRIFGKKIIFGPACSVIFLRLLSSIHTCKPGMAYPHYNLRQPTTQLDWKLILRIIMLLKILESIQSALHINSIEMTRQSRVGYTVSI